jgi:hypothetical protein
MPSLPPKKGPHRMTRVGNPAVDREEAERQDFKSKVDASADRVFAALERARGKMSPADRARAVRNSETILSEATDGATPRRKRA